MGQRTRGEPRSRALRKSEERRITALIASVPDVEPELSITPLHEVAFDVSLREAPGCPLRLEVGGVGFYADYAVGTRRLLEGSLLRVTRRVKVRRMWCLEVYETGGAPARDGFSIVWHGRQYYRVSRGRGYLFDPLAPEERTEFPFPRHLPATDARCEGYHVVTVGGHRHDCVRVLSLWRDPGEPAQAVLDDSYISRQGRTILAGRFQSREHARWFAELRRRRRDAGPPAEGVRAREAGTITHDGTEFTHWYDTLTDASLAPLLEPR